MIIEKKLNEITLGDLLDLLISMKENEAKPKAKKAVRHCGTKAKPVNQYTLDGKYINTYPSLSAAARSVFGQPTGGVGIGKVCIGKWEQFHGFKWKFVVDDPNPQKSVTPKAQQTESNPYPAAECNSPMQKRMKMHSARKPKPVNQFDSKGELLATYDSQSKAAKVTGCSQSNISKCCHGTRDSVNGFRFEFVK